MQQDAGAFRSWCSSCEALCATVGNQLQMIGCLVNCFKHPYTNQYSLVMRSGVALAAPPTPAVVQHVRQDTSQQHEV
jgi:hypothetical protein